MIHSLKIENFTEVKTINQLAQDLQCDIGIHDANGSIADAKSLLGLMSLDYSKPVSVVCENEKILDLFVRAMECHGNLEKLFAMLNPSLHTS